MNETGFDMDVSAIDSNKYSTRLMEKGVAPEIAAIHAEAMGEIVRALIALDAKVERYHAEEMVEFANVRKEIAQQGAVFEKRIGEQTTRIGELKDALHAVESKVVTLETRLVRSIIAIAGFLAVLQGGFTYSLKLFG